MSLANGESKAIKIFDLHGSVSIKCQSSMLIPHTAQTEKDVYIKKTNDVYIQKIKDVCVKKTKHVRVKKTKDVCMRKAKDVCVQKAKDAHMRDVQNPDDELLDTAFYCPVTNTYVTSLKSMQVIQYVNTI